MYMPSSTVGDYSVHFSVVVICPSVPSSVSSSVPVVVVVVIVRPLSVSLSVLLCPSFRPVVRSVVVDVRPLSSRPVKQFVCARQS